MKRTIVLLLAALLPLALAACGKTQPLPPTTQAPTTAAPTTIAPTTQAPTAPPSANTAQAPSYLTDSEVSVNGVTAASNRAEIIRLLGEPLRTETDGIVSTLDYGTVSFTVALHSAYPDDRGRDKAWSAAVSGKAAQTPRDIQVGQTFEEVMAKFPQEKDFRADPRGFFYGSLEVFGDASGSVGEKDGKICITLTTGNSYVEIRFASNLVEEILVAYTGGL